MATDEDLRSYALSIPEVAGMIGARWHQNTVPGPGATLPYVWCRRSREDFGDELGARDPERTFFEVECVSDDLGEALHLGDLLKRQSPQGLEGVVGQMGTGIYAWVSVDDAYDDYVPRNLEADERLQVSAFTVEVAHA